MTKISHIHNSPPDSEGDYVAFFTIKYAWKQRIGKINSLVPGISEIFPDY